MKNVLLFSVCFMLSFFLISCSKTEQTDVTQLKNALCYNEDGIIVECKDYHNPDYSLASMEAKGPMKRYDGGECIIFVGGQNCRALTCWESTVAMCGNAFPCTVCGNCNNPAGCFGANN